MCVCACVCVHVRVCVCVCVCVRACVYTCVHTCVHVCVRVQRPVCGQMYVRLCTVCDPHDDHTVMQSGMCWLILKQNA